MTWLSDTARAALSGAYRYSGALWVHEVCLQRSFMSILLFHRVTDVVPEDPLTVSTARFRSICGMLVSRFHVVPLSEIFLTLQQGKPIRRRTVALTFDDCYLDNLGAARQLAELGLPATFFIPTGYVGTTHTFPWDEGLPQMPNLSWDDVRAIAALGHEIGSHTVSHIDLGRATLEEARRELVESRETLQEQVGRPVRWFAYPYGGRQHLRPEMVPLIGEAGYEGTVSAIPGFVDHTHHGAVLPRIAMPNFRSLSHLEVYLAGCLKWWHELRGSHGEPTGYPPAPQRSLCRADLR
jgi:peptidoglycan/xylan/chitin deacetylase (PgdA/CDA1 family)